MRRTLMFLLWLANPLLAEEAGSVSGMVRDPDGKPVIGASVSIRSGGGAVLASGKTDENGKFQFRSIRPGHYLLMVRAEGFRDEEMALQQHSSGRNDVVVNLGMPVLSEEITVTSNRERVEEIEDVPQQVNVVSEEELRARVKTVLAQVADEEVGVTLQRTSPTIGAIFVRGLTGNKVNTFVDGIRYSTGAMRGGINTFFNLLGAPNLQRVEILRGPSSSEYGSDAIGGSIQLISRVPSFSSGGTATEGGASVYANSSDSGYGSDVWTSYGSTNFAVIASANGSRANELRAGEGIDSHNAVTRFFDIPSDSVFNDRLPETEYTQYGGMLKLAWIPEEESQFTAAYIRGQQDDGKRYDQLIGGDGNLIADLRNLMADLFYLKYDRSGLGWFDFFTTAYSFNSQREERVNQGGNGNPLAAINHEYERTTVHGLQTQLSKALGLNQTLSIGADFYNEGIEAPSFREDPASHATSIRRGRVPDGASYNNAGIFVEYVFEPLPDRLKLFTNVRYSFANYEASASDSPLVNGEPLWPDDSLDVDSVTYRIGSLWTVLEGMDLFANFSTGFRAPHITDLGTLGLTGAGFEVAFADVSGLGATIGSSASRSATSTGIAVEELKPEKSRMFEIGTRVHRDRIKTSFGFFLNDVDDNIVKQALILPPGAVGIVLGDEPIIAQNENGAVFVAASTSPVLVRTNFDDARIWGIEYSVDYTWNSTWKAGGNFTYLHAEDKRTGLPPNIEGGTPAPQGYAKVRYTSSRKKIWVEPFIHFAFEQDRLSSLDLEDRRTGAARSRSSISDFFRNGAAARGLIGPGADSISGTADDILLETGETLDQILLRVLGPGLESNSLFTEIPAYTIWNVRFGFTLAERHQFLVELQNLTDKNYRGISWGMDAPGRGIYARYIVGF